MIADTYPDDINTDIITLDPISDQDDLAFEIDPYELSPIAERAEQSLLWNNAVRYQIRQCQFRAAQSTLSSQIYVDEMDMIGWLNLTETRLYLENYSNAFYALDKVFKSMKSLTLSRQYWQVIEDWIGQGILDPLSDLLVDQSPEYLQQSLNINELLVSYWICIGIMEFSRQNYDNAIISFDRATLLDEQCYLGWMGLYRCFQRQCRSDRAIEILSKYTQIIRNYRVKAEN